MINHTKIADLIRAELSPLDCADFTFELTISGRVHKGEAACIYRLKNGHYGPREVDVQGDCLESVLAEFKRRHKWTAVHGSLRIAHVRDEEAPAREPIDDEIPF